MHQFKQINTHSFNLIEKKKFELISSNRFSLSINQIPKIYQFKIKKNKINITEYEKNKIKSLKDFKYKLKEYFSSYLIYNDLIFVFEKISKDNTLKIILKSSEYNLIFKELTKNELKDEELNYFYIFYKCSIEKIIQENLLKRGFVQANNNIFIQKILKKNDKFFYEFKMFPSLKFIINKDIDDLFISILPINISQYNLYTYYIDLINKYSLTETPKENVEKKFIKSIICKKLYNVFGNNFLCVERIIFDKPENIKMNINNLIINIGEYYTNKHQIKLTNEIQPFATIYSKKLKQNIIIPFLFLHLVGEINKNKRILNYIEIIKDINEIFLYNSSIEFEKKIEFYSILPLPNIIFKDKNIIPEEKTGYFKRFSNKSLDLLKLTNISIIYFDMDKIKAEKFWKLIYETSLSLNISLPINPHYYLLNNIVSFIKEIKNNKTEFIFIFKNTKKKNDHLYIIKNIYLSDLNIPTQTVIVNKKKGNSLINIISDMLCKLQKQIYNVDFSFLDKNIIICSYNVLSFKENNLITSFCITTEIGTNKYIYYQEIIEKSDKNMICYNIGKLFHLGLKPIIKKNNNYKDLIIIIYRRNGIDFLIKNIEIESIKNSFINFKNSFNINISFCLLSVKKLKNLKLYKGDKNNNINNISVGTYIIKKDFFILNSIFNETNPIIPIQYTILYDNTNIKEIIPKITFYLCFSSGIHDGPIKFPTPLFLVTKRNKFIIEFIDENIKEKYKNYNIGI